MSPRRSGQPGDDAPPQRATSVLSVLRSVVRHRPRAASALVVCSLLAGLSESVILALVANVAQALVDGTTTVELSVGALDGSATIGSLLAIAGGLAGTRLLLQVALAWLPAHIAATTQEAQRNRLFEAYSRATWDVQAEEHDGHLQELLTTQITHATFALLVATNLVAAGFTFAMLVVGALAIDPVAALLVLVVAALLAAILRPLGQRGRRHSGRLSEAQLAYAAEVGAAVRLAEETFTFGVARAEQERLRHQVASVSEAYLRTQFTQRLTQGLYQGLVILLLVGGLAALHLAGTEQITSLGAVVLILVRASSYGQQAQVAWQVIQQAGPFLDRIAAEVDRYDSGAQVAGTHPFPLSGPIRFEQVRFGYRADRPVLEDLDLVIERGTTVGLVGPSGSGKSTIVQLLLRMRSPSGGTITIDGVPLDQIDQRSWFEHVAYVPQESRLLQASVAANIRFARPLDDRSVEDAARLANIHDEITAMPQGYGTTIGQRADAVSGGQRQRICLARALAGRPSLLILDEPTSSLDDRSEARIQRSLHELHGTLTIVVVAHRPALLDACDRIIRLDPHRRGPIEVADGAGA